MLTPEQVRAIRSTAVEDGWQHEVCDTALAWRQEADVLKTDRRKLVEAAVRAGWDARNDQTQWVWPHSVGDKTTAEVIADRVLAAHDAERP